jgi:hypothetical protein
MDGLSLEDFRQALKRPVPPLLIDVRDEDAYAAASGVIPGDKIAEIRAANPVPAKSFGSAGLPAQNAITPGPLETILATKGQASQGMFKVVIGRPGTMHSTPVGKEMGINTWAAFGGSDSQAVIDGDFVMTENELQPVLKAMRREGINIVAIHQHMSEEQPRFLFLHYWGKGDAAGLAQEFKRVLDAQAAATN